MHRHAYQGRKLSRDAGPRAALVRGQITSLVLYEQIETTLAKAKEVAPAFERLVTKAKRASLADRRAIQAEISTELAVRKLIQEIAPAMADRSSGYTRIIKTANRRGDNAPMAILTLTDRPKVKKPAEAKTEAAEIKDEPTKVAKKPVAKKPTAAKKSEAKK